MGRPYGWFVHLACRRNWSSIVVTWRGSSRVWCLSTIPDDQQQSRVWSFY